MKGRCYMAQGVITLIGRKKLCKAHAGDLALPAITQMQFGGGGVDANGNVIEATGAETALKAALFKKEVDGHAYTDGGETTCRYTARLGKADLANQSISELGLFDREGSMVAYKTMLPKGKDDDMEFVFDMDEIF